MRQKVDPPSKRARTWTLPKGAPESPAETLLAIVFVFFCFYDCLCFFLAAICDCFLCVCAIAFVFLVAFCDCFCCFLLSQDDKFLE